MGYEKSPPRHDWRSRLTAEEMEEVRSLDAEIEAGRKAMSALSPIRNRAIQRCRYAEFLAAIEKERAL